MEGIVATVLAFLEMTFIFVALSLLHSQRKVIGNAAFYIAIGLLFVFTQFVSAAELKVYTGVIGFDFYIGPTALFLPYLGALMLIYITEGTLAAQRLIIGAMAGLGLFMYLGSLTQSQCNWLGFAISQGASADSFNYLLQQSRHAMSGSILAQVLDLFLLPIFFQRLRNLKCRMFICVVVAMMLTQLIDSFVYLFATQWDKSHWWIYINSSFLVKSLATVLISILITIYLKRIEKEIPGEGRGTLDILFAFFGGYGRAEALQKDLREWEGRYRMVVENASEIIMLLGTNGKIIDANRSALNILRFKNMEELTGLFFWEMLHDQKEQPVTQAEMAAALSDPAKVFRSKYYVERDGFRIYLDIAVSSIVREEVRMLIVVARDITDEVRLAREKEMLGEQLAHSQRLEAIGQLAGGVAHDFNNHIHAILGHLDVIRYIHHIDDPKISHHLDKITRISEEAGKLTNQLLGFARKGKYKQEVIELKELLNKTVELFLPKSHKDLDLEINVSEGDMRVMGDLVQLSQVLINLLINAKDAIDGNRPEMGMKIQIRVDAASAFKIKLMPPPDFEKRQINSDDYFCIMIKDNGMGMDNTTMQRIFEPFFTTKPYGKGTGMGLAMVYGTVTNHHGWVQVKSVPGKGSAFYVILPKYSGGETG